MVTVSELVAFLGAVKLDTVDGVALAEIVVTGLVVPLFKAAVSEVMILSGAIKEVVID